MIWGASIICLPLLLCGQEIDNAPSRDYNAAAALQNAGLHQRASVKWSEFISQYPQDERIGQAHYYLGVCQLRRQKFKEAVETFRKVLSSWPNLQQADKAQYNLAMAQFDIASSANNADGFRNAAKEFELVGRKYPNSSIVDESIYYRGDCLQNAGDFVGAADAYQQLISKHPDSPMAARAHYDLGVAQQQIGEPASATKTFQAFLAKPEYASHELIPEISLRLGICLHNANQLDAAARHLEKASQMKGFELADYAAIRLGQTKRRQKKYKETAQLMANFPKQFPNSEYRSDALMTAGQCYFLADDPKSAIRVLPPVANGNDPPAAEAAYWLGRAQLKLGQAEQALRTIEKAIGRFSESDSLTKLTFARIDALYAIPNRRAETPALYEAFAGQHSDHALASRAAYMAALSWYGEQQYQRAREMAEASWAKYGSTEFVPDLKYIAAESHLLESPDNSKARASAEALYRELVDSHPKHSRAPQSQLRIGWCLQSDGKPQQAIDYLRGALSGFDKDQQVPEAQLIIGRCHAKLEQHRQAVTALEAAIAAGGKWNRLDEVLLAAAESHRALGEHDAAIGKLRRLVTTQSASRWRPQALYWLGEMAQQKDQPDQALGWFQQVAQKYRDSEFGGPAIHALAAIYLSKDDFAASRQWATQLVKSQYSNDLKQRGRYLRGLSHYRERDFASASADLDAYQKKPVDETEATNAAHLLSLCLIEQQQLSEAREVLDELLKTNPDFSRADETYYELGHALRKQENQGAAAAAAFQWIADNRPDSRLAAESLFRVAQHHVDVAQGADDEQEATAYQAAEDSLTRGIARVKEKALHENMLFLLGDSQFQQSRFKEAAETLTRQIGEFPAGKYVGPASFLAAQSRYRMQHFDQALPLFESVSEMPIPNASKSQLESYRSQSLYRAADCAAKLQRWQQSRAHFQRLIDRHPEFPQRADAIYGMAYALQQQDELDRAIELYDQVTKETESETAAKARFMVGEIEFSRQKYEDAIEQFLIVTVGYAYEPWQAVARFETARCFMELGDQTRAAATLREMIEKHPQHLRTGDAKKMLEDLSQ